MTLIPGIKQISQVGNEMYIQGAFPVGIGTTEVSYLADPADTRLLTGRDPVLEEVSVGMSGVETELKYATGAQPLHITDAMNGNTPFLNVGFLPVQDLHGYDAPWPAGGGKNLLDYSTATISSNSVSFESGLQIEANQTYTFSYYGTDAVTVICYKHGTSTRIFTSGYVNTYTYTFEESESVDVTFYNSTGITRAEYLFQIEKGSSSSSWSPYANLCPITGWSQIKLFNERTYDASAQPQVIAQLGDMYYGGTVDLASGILSITHGYISDISELTWTEISGVYRSNSIQNPMPKPGIPGCISDTYEVVYPNSTALTNNYQIAPYNTVGRYLSCLVVPTSGAVCYEMDTPIYLQIDPVSLNIMRGESYVWTDTNVSDISLTYVSEK